MKAKGPRFTGCPLEVEISLTVCMNDMIFKLMDLKSLPGNKRWLIWRIAPVDSLE